MGLIEDMKVYLACFMVFLFSYASSAKAQNSTHKASNELAISDDSGNLGYSIGGKIFDANSRKPVHWVEVEILQLDSSDSLARQFSDSLGNFLLHTKIGGRYRIKFSAAGYPFFLADDTIQLTLKDPNFSCGNIFIQKDAEGIETIKEVEIQGSGPLVENKIDRLVYNAAQDITAKGGSAADLLAKVPMVEVDMDGNPSIRGSKNIKILINGKTSGMMSGNVSDALRALPSEGIDKVEVITNPSAKYDAEGSAGIINIVMKQVKIQGKTGSLTSGLGTRSANFGGDVSILKGSNIFTFRLGGYFWRSWGSGKTDRMNAIEGKEFALKQNNNVKNWGGGPRLSLSADHQFNKKSAITFATNINSRFRNSDNRYTTYTGIQNEPLFFLWNQHTINSTLGLGVDINIDYRRTCDKKDREYGISVQFSGSEDDADYSLLRSNASQRETRKEKSLNKSRNNELSFQFDYSEPIGKKTVWESGVKTTLRKVKSVYDFDSFDYRTTVYTSIADRNNQFDYFQNVVGIYSQFAYLYNANYSMKVGARYEATQFGGVLYMPIKDSYSGMPYQNVIPYVNVNRKIGSGGYVRASYTKRIQRPSLFYLNPYTNFSDPLNTLTGNPYLNAEMSNNFEISTGNYTQIGGVGLVFFHRRIGNAIETIREVGSDKVYRTTYGNIGVNYTTGIDLNLSLKGKIHGNDWTINFNGGLGWVDIRSRIDTGILSGIRNQGLSYNAGLRSSFKLSKAWQLEGWGRFNAPTFSLQGSATNWFYHMVGIKYRFNQDKGGFGFGLDNPFMPKTDFITQTKGKDFSFSSVQRIYMWGVRINFDYKFGTFQVVTPKTVLRKLQIDDLKPASGQEGL